ncbi:hypothetical protein AA309_21230 [Microvirga vignae]|uniref:Uncharacterized protein n=1 Tax=Microvirga vignae TaxID=1225564 RepID=A0A0H1R8M9_9HYPH|nr:hypothetical protein [Microvirga vignae]KLK91201.1 hypothetical protein AA309_21230 [Microvirga vignae]
MDQPYSPWADWLSKFHTWAEAIQALWLVAVPLTLLGLTWLVMRGLRDLIGPARHDEGRLIYGVYQDAQGRWMVYRHNRQPQEIDWENAPPELIGRGQMIDGVFRRPEV